MGRPIKKQWFGLPHGRESAVHGVKFSDGFTATSAFIIKQTGATSYLVQDRDMVHAPEILFLANALVVSALMPGQCYIHAVPFGGTALPCESIEQYTLTVYDTPNTVPRVTGYYKNSNVTEYRWSITPASKKGEADLIGGANEVNRPAYGTPLLSAGKSITSGTLQSYGFGYPAAPTVVITDPTGTGATAVASWDSTGIAPAINMTNYGKNYTNPTITLTPNPPPPVRATATATVDGNGGIASVTITNGGSYYSNSSSSKPNVSGAPGTGANLTTTVVNGVVTNVTITAPGAGYVNPILNFPLANSTPSTFKAVMTYQSIDGVTVTDAGVGYVTPPTVTFSGNQAWAVDATATATIAAGKVTGVNVSNTGSGYLNTVTSTFSPPPES